MSKIIRREIGKKANKYRKLKSAWETDNLVIDLLETEDTVMCLLCSVTMQCKTHHVKKTR